MLVQDPIQNMCEYADPGNQWWRAQEIRFLLLVKETEIEFLVLALALAQPLQCDIWRTNQRTGMF